MFDTINDHQRPLPSMAVFATVVGLLEALSLWSVAVSSPRKILSPPSSAVVKLIKPWKASKVRRMVPKQKPVGVHGRYSVAGAPAVIARPGTPAWSAHVQNGRVTAFQVWALDSLAVLRAHGVTLALDTVRPRGVTYLYDLGTKAYGRGPLPDNIVLRELSDLPPSRDIEEARQRTERELGERVRVFALYPVDLYYALRSYTEDALRQAGVPPESVVIARVRLHLVAERDFAVTLIDHS
jgi:hypothetical protein